MQLPKEQTVWVCTRCGNCCRWPGQVRLTDADVTRAAGFLELAEQDFIDEHTELSPDRRGLSLRDGADGACEFFEEPNRCRIQEAKPAQCHGFPNQWRFDGFEKECPAIKLSMRLAPNREPHEESTCGNE